MLQLGRSSLVRTPVSPHKGALPEITIMGILAILNMHDCRLR
jgi:hypothetical protein